MSATEHPFRGAAFGGFNRKDVIHYIETANRTHREKIAQLQGNLEAEGATRLSLESKLAAAESQAAAAEARAKKAEEDLARVSAELRGLTASAEGKTIRLEALERENSDLREQVRRMTPAASAYESLKDRAATIELEAHNRAANIVAEAEGSAESIRAAVLAWVEKVKASYLRLRGDASATLTHTGGELERARRALESADGALSAQDEELERLFSACQSPIGERQ